MKSGSHNFLIYLIIILFNFFSVSQSFGETYQFERMWPVLKQPWYFYRPAGLAADNSGFIYVADSQNDRIQKFTSDGQFVTQWGTTGIEDEQFDSPYGIAVDRDGFIYVTDSQNSRIQKFTPDGQFVIKWGQFGTGDEAFANPFGIAASPDGYIYVADTENDSIKKFTGDGKFVTRWGTTGSADGEFFWPYGVAVDKKGFVYVTDSQNSRIQKFDSAGRFINKWGTGDGEFDWPDGVALDDSGFLYVADSLNNRVQKFTTDGQFIAQWGSTGSEDDSFDSPGGIAYRNGSLYVADSGNNRIQKFTAEGQFVSRWGKGNAEGEFNSPDGIAADQNGNIYVADTDNHRIQKFAADGQFITQWGREGDGDGEFFWPARITVSQDFVYVTDTGNDRIEKFSPDGQFVSKWGSRGVGDGEFNLPYETATDSDGFIYVADRGNHRIQKFDSEGQFAAKWGKQGSDQGEFDNPHGIAVRNGFVYVADTGNSRIQKFSTNGLFMTEWGKEGNGYGEFSIPYSVTVDSQGSVYVVDSGNHRIQKFTSEGQFVTVWGEEGSYPGQLKYPGAGAVGANGDYYIADNHNHRVQVFKKTASDFNNKAIIVAGGGPYPGNHLWNATRMCANFAYRTLNYQGFSKENVCYLSSDTNLDLDNNGEADDIDGDATNSNLQEALTKWAADAASLTIYLVNHGGEEMFRMNPTETLSAAELASWLDQFPGSAMMIYDACGSGSFLAPLASSGNHRIIITGTSPKEDAHFISSGSLSFSNFFWENIFNGLTVKAAFEQSREAVSHITEFQNPLLDGNGDGQANTSEDFYAVQNMKIGSGTDMHWDTPEIADVWVENSAVCANVTDKDGIARVWAVFIPLDYGRGLTPVLELPSAELMYDEGNQYKAVYEGLTNNTGSIAVYARDRTGNTSTPELVPLSLNNPLKRKAIIVAGDSRSDLIRAAAERNAAFAYNVLRYQGYADEDIYSKDWDPSAIEEWLSQNTLNLAIYLVGSGEDGHFQLNDNEMLSYGDLNAWLDSLQIKDKIAVVCDADYSGSLIPLLKPPSDKERILISGTASDQPALFLSQGDISFSSFFWNGVSNGLNVRDAFMNAKNAVRFFSQDKTPQIDDNGNGIGNERQDGQLAMDYTIGIGIKYANEDPIVGFVSSSNEILTGGEISANLWAEDVTATAGGIEKVWAVITPPGYDSDEYFDSKPELATFELNHTGEGQYEGIYNDFSSFGTYQADIYAMDTNGNISLSKKTSVYQSAGPDIYETDNSFDEAGIILINSEIPQHRNLYDASDEDWVKFYGLSGRTYEMRISGTGENFYAIIEICDSDGAPISQNTASVSDTNESWIWSWKCEQDDAYYVKISHDDSEGFGEGTAYDLAIYQSVAPFPGWMKGSVTDKDSGKPVEGARIKTDAYGSCISRPSGRYLIIHEPGNFSATVEASGYKSEIYSDISVSEGGTTIRNFELNSLFPPEQTTTTAVQPDPLPPLPSNDDVEKVSCFIGTIKT